MAAPPETTATSLPDRAQVRAIAQLLDRFIAAERLTKDDREVIHEELEMTVAALSRSGFVAALDMAVGRNPRRRKVSIYLLCAHADLSEVQERIGASLADPDPEWRRWLIQTVGDLRLIQFAPALNRVIEHDPDLFARQFAIMAASKLRDDVNLPALLALGEDHGPDLRGRWVWALKEYAREECRPGLRSVFAVPQETPTGRTREEWGLAKEDRVVAAWGLGKLGDPEALAFLVEMLADPNLRLPNGCQPGVSLRAAQALSDIYKWPFRWAPEALEETRERLAAAMAVDGHAGG